MGQVVRQDERLFVLLASSEQRLGCYREVVAQGTEAELVGNVGRGNGSSFRTDV